MNEKESVKVSGLGMWFSRKKSEEKPAPEVPVKTLPQRKPPTRSNTLLWTKKPLVEEPIEEIETPGVSSRPKPSRSRTLAGDTAAWLTRRDTKDDTSSKDEKKDAKESSKPARPAHQKARSETSVSTRPRSATHSEVTKSHTTDEHGNEGMPSIPIPPACRPIESSNKF